MSQLFRRKPIAALLVDEADAAHSLKRVLGAGDLVMLAIGAVIGAGIFLRLRRRRIRSNHGSSVSAQGLPW
jgi:APA family basic amino acid/polyamine antiporter